jgi:hypothetical protein
MPVSNTVSRTTRARNENLQTEHCPCPLCRNERSMAWHYDDPNWPTDPGEPDMGPPR